MPRTRHQHTTVIEGTLEIQHLRGVIYFHPKDVETFGATCLRICQLPTPVPQLSGMWGGRLLDITHMRGCDWHTQPNPVDEHAFEPSGTVYPDNLYCGRCGFRNGPSIVNECTHGYVSNCCFVWMYRVV